MNAWLLAGYTMLHFMWSGALVAAAGAAVRLAVRRAGPNVRYGASLVTLSTVACAPAVIAAWLAMSGLRPDGGAEALAERQVATGGDVVGSEFRRNSATVGDSLRESGGAEATSRTVELKGAERGGRNVAPTIESTSPAEKLTTALRSVATGDRAQLVPSSPGRGSVVPLARLVDALPYVWLAGAPVTFLLLAAGLVGSGRVRRAGRAIVDGPVVEACARLGAALRVSRRVALAVVDGLAQPVLVGIVRPTILLPAAALSGWTVEELEMVLLHELAHVRRLDNAVNLAQRLVESLLFFHPCVWLASRQVRRDREDCCDWVVVEHTARPEAYAELLVSVAAGLAGARRGRRGDGPRGRAPRLAAFSERLAMADHPLAGRVRRILKLEDEPMWVSRRMLGLVVALAIGMTTAVYQAAFAQSEAIAAEQRAKPRAAGEVAEKRILVYQMSDIKAIDAVAWLRLTAVGNDVEIQWFEKNKSLIVNATEAVHEQLADLLEQSRKAEAAHATGLREVDAQELERVLATVSAELKRKLQELETKMKGSDKAQFMEIRYPKLKADIQLYQSQLIQLDRDLADIEVMKQMAILQAQSPSALEAAVEIEMEKDPTIAMYKEQLFVLSQQIEQLKASSRNQGNAQLRQLQGQYAEIEQTMKTYRVKAEKDARERLAEVPNENLRAAMIEHEVRSKYLADKKAELTKKLRDAEAEIEEGAIVDPEIEMLQLEIESQQALIATLNQKILQAAARRRAIERGQSENYEKIVSVEMRINSEGTATLDGIAVTRDELGERLPDGGDVRVRLVIDQGRPYQEIIAWIDAMHAAGVHKISVKLQDDAAEASAPAAFPEDPNADAPDNHGTTRTPYRLRPGDTLLVDTYGNLPDRPTGQFVVEDEGTIAIGAFYGRVEVAGLTVREAEAAVLKLMTEALKNIVEETLRVQVTLHGKANRGAKSDGGDQGADVPMLTVKFPAGMGEAEAHRVVEALRGRGIAAAAVSVNGKLLLQITSPTPLPRLKVVWESYAEGDRIQRMCRFLSEEGEFPEPPFGNPTAVGASPSKLSPGDLIMVRVLGALADSPIDNTLEIEDEGTIALGPGYGRVAVGGLTVLEAEAAITEHLKPILKSFQVQVTRPKRTESFQSTAP